MLDTGRGSWLTDVHGRELLDAFAGLWCVNIGYGQESVVEAATNQMRKLPYATGYFGFASEPAIRLAAKLVELTPPSLTRAYLTLGGSEAVDAAVRFIVQYWNARGRPAKKHFISLERGYHGSSSTGAGLTALPVFHRGFDLPLPTQHYIPSPNPYRHPQGDDAQALIASSVAALRAKVAELGADNVAAFFCEPIQGSGGVIVPPTGWLKAMREAARELDILFVVDEVITGFGRTGPMFACEAEGVDPDLMTLAKGLTAGYVPMGATMLSEPIYAAIADAAPPGVAIGHGATYSAHPVGAAVALEVLRLYDEGGVIANGQRVARTLCRGPRRFAGASTGRRCTVSRPPRCARARKRQGDQARLRCLARDFRTESSQLHTPMASCSAASAMRSSGSRPPLRLPRRSSRCCSRACGVRSTRC